MIPLRRRLHRALAPLPTITDYNDAHIAETVWRKTMSANHAAKPAFHFLEARAILDFGGGAGTAFYRAFLHGLSLGTRWAIVETPAMVAYCTDRHLGHRLRWFVNVYEAANWLGEIDLIHCDGALQYTDDPHWTVLRLASLNARELYYNRTFLNNGKPEIEQSFLSDHGPGDPYGLEAIVRVTRRPLPRKTFINAHEGYAYASVNDPYHFVKI